jgi:hypothetical protein
MTQGSQTMPGSAPGAPGPAAAAGSPAPAGPRLTPVEEGALAHARADRTPYGRWRKRDLEYAVAGSEHVGDITRVRITYRPASGFRGRPGEEVIELGPGGEVVAREQLHPPQEAFPWVLAGFAALSALAAAAMIPLIIINPVRGDPLYVPGRILYMRVTEPAVVPVLHFQNLDINGNLSSFAISPSTEDRRLAVVQVTLINQQSNDVVVVVDQNSASMLTEAGDTVRPIDTVLGSQAVERIDPRYAYAGFVPLWTTVSLGGGQQVTGMLVFEVAPGSRFKEFRWEATDSMIVRYP